MFPNFVALSQQSASSQRGVTEDVMDTDADVVTSTTANTGTSAVRLTDFEQFDDQACEDLTIREQAEYDAGEGDVGEGGEGNRSFGESRDLLGPMPGTKQDTNRRSGGKKLMNCLIPGGESVSQDEFQTKWCLLVRYISPLGL